MKNKNYTVYHSPGKILRLEPRVYVDQLSEGHKIFYSENAKDYLRSTYGLEIYEYYNLIVYGRLEVELLCPNCKKNSMKFKGLTKGWATYCNQSCITSFRLKKESEMGINPFQNKEFIEVNRKRVSEFQKKRMANGESHLLTKENQLKASRNNFIKNHINETCYFYICRLHGKDGYFKIGICSTNSPSNRANYKSYKLYNHHILVKSTAEIVSGIEYRIKSELCDGLEETVLESQLHDVFDIIRNY